MSCINFYSFALGVLLDKKQKNLNHSDFISGERHTTIRENFSYFNEDILPQSNQLASYRPNALSAQAPL